MKIEEKIDKYLNEAKEIPNGLKSFVADYIIMRNAGNTKMAKEVKKNIENEIKKLGLNKKEVFSVFGDPDNPKEKDKVLKKAKEFSK